MSLVAGIGKPLVKGVGSAVTRGGGGSSSPRLLDVYPSAAAAYSYRSLKSGVSSFYTGTTNASEWLDQSGNGQHLTAAGSGNQPAITAAGLSFDGVDDYLSKAFTLEQPYTLFTRFKLGSYDSGEQFSLNQVIDGATGNSITLRRVAGTLMHTGAGTLLTQALIGRNTEEMLLTILFDGANSKIWKNGTLFVSGDAGTADPDGLVVGAFPGGLRFSEQVVKHLVVYPSDVSADRAAIEAFLTDSDGCNTQFGLWAEAGSSLTFTDGQTAADGSSAATLATTVANTGAHRIYVSLGAGTRKLQVKAGTTPYIGISANDSDYGSFDLSDGSKSESGGTAAITALSDGWYEIEFLGASSYFIIYVGETSVAQARPGSSYLGTGKTIYIANAKLDDSCVFA